MSEQLKDLKFEEDDAQVDAVFGDIEEGGPNYRNVGWISTTVLLVKCQIGLGVLSLPAVFQVLGLVPGLICIIVVALITTCKCSQRVCMLIMTDSAGTMLVVGQFKLRHPEIYGYGDVGLKLGGRIGEEICSFGFWLCKFHGSSERGTHISHVLRWRSRTGQFGYQS